MTPVPTSPRVALGLISFDMKGMEPRLLLSCAVSTCFRLKCRNSEKERCSFIKGAPQRGFIPLLSYLSIPPRHSSTITLPSPSFSSFSFHGVAAAFSPFFSAQSLCPPTLLLSGPALERARVCAALLLGQTLTLSHARAQEELQPLLFYLISSYEWMHLHRSTEHYFNLYRFFFFFFKG